MCALFAQQLAALVRNTDDPRLRRQIVKDAAKQRRLSAAGRTDDQNAAVQPVQSLPQRLRQRAGDKPGNAQTERRDRCKPARAAQPGHTDAVPARHCEITVLQFLLIRIDAVPAQGKERLADILLPQRPRSAQHRQQLCTGHEPPGDCKLQRLPGAQAYLLYLRRPGGRQRAEQLAKRRPQRPDHAVVLVHPPSPHTPTVFRDKPP